MSTDFFHDAIQPTLFDDDGVLIPMPEVTQEYADSLVSMPFSMPEYLAFPVKGVPAPQGSKNTYGGRPTKAGGISKPHTTEANPRTRPWRMDVRDAAETAVRSQGWQIAEGAVEVSLIFYKKRPLAHYGTGKNSNVLKKDAPHLCITGPDIDKLSRAILDSLTTAGVYRDDKQVADLHARHVYAARDSDFAAGGVFVQVQPAE
jgi:Holliday junction resolvase RusA-like endonuclease